MITHNYQLSTISCSVVEARVHIYSAVNAIPFLLQYILLHYLEQLTRYN